MRLQSGKWSTRRMLLCLPLTILFHLTYAQSPDTSLIPGYFNGAITLTNKGISTVPNLTLGKPAAIFDLALGKKRLSFEPQLRFALEGKPWTFLFWWRYKVVNSNKLKFTVGAHPALAFKTKTVEINGKTTEELIANRYLAGEINQNYLLTPGFGLGGYYLYSHGIEKNITRNTHFIAFRLGFNHISLGKSYYLRFNPQVYYLNMDHQDGFYYNTSLTLAKDKFPFTLSGLINKCIHTNIPVGEDLLWNISISYSFHNDYRKK